MKPVNLKYLFGVRYSDKSEYFQTPSDTSLTDPTRSAFFDVMKRYEDVEVFQLTGDGHKYLVDLRDGHFEIDGVPFWMDGPEDQPFRLIYFRRHTHTLNAAFAELAHTIEYCFGWQTTADGKNHQQIMILK